MSENNLVASGMAWLRSSALGKMVQKLATPEPKKAHLGPVREVSSEILSDGSEIVKYSDGSARRVTYDTFGVTGTFGKSRSRSLGEGDDYLTTHEQRALIGSVRESVDASELSGVVFIGERRGVPVDAE